MPVIPEDPDSIILEDQKEAYIQGLYEVMKYYESLLETAPDDSELEEATYQLIDRGSSCQCNMSAITDDTSTIIDFVNWETGASFLLESSQYKYENSGIYDEFVTYESMEGTWSFLKPKRW